MDSSRKYEVSGREVCWHCNTAEFRFHCTDELAPPQGLIGQDRAMKAIQFGLEVDKPGYNLFVTGLTGTGKTSAIKSHVQAVIDERQERGVHFPIYDWCYLYNFSDPDRPQMARLVPGRAKVLRRGLEELLRTLQEEIPKVFSGEEYTAERKRLEEGGEVRAPGEAAGVGERGSGPELRTAVLSGRTQSVSGDRRRNSCVS